MKATLIPVGTNLPLGRLVPVSQVSSPARTTQDPSPFIQRETTAPTTTSAPRQEPIRPSGEPITAPGAQEPTPVAQPPQGSFPASQPASESTISDSEWNRLKRFMEGHQEKLAREKASPEQVQRRQEKAEQETLQKKAEEETKRRQELARAGKLPKAQVVYLSGDDPAPTPIQKAPDTAHPPQTKVAPDRVEAMPLEPADVGLPEDQPELEDHVQLEPAAEARPEQRIETKSSTGPVQPPASRAAPVEQPPTPSPTKGLQRRSQDKPAPTSIQPPAGEQSQDIQTADVDAFSPESETAQTQVERPLSIESRTETPAAPPVEITPEYQAPVEPSAAGESHILPRTAIQTKTEPGSQHAAEPTPVEKPVVQEKKGVGQRILKAARSLFQRQDEPAELQETRAVPKSEGAGETAPIDAAREPSAEDAVLQEKPQLDIGRSEEVRPGARQQIRAPDAPLGAQPTEPSIQAATPPALQETPKITPKVTPRVTPPVVQRSPETPAQVMPAPSTPVVSAPTEPAGIDRPVEERLGGDRPPLADIPESSPEEMVQRQPKSTSEPPQPDSTSRTDREPDTRGSESREKIKLTAPATSVAREADSDVVESPAVRWKVEERPAAAEEPHPSDDRPAPADIEPSQKIAKQEKQTGQPEPAAGIPADFETVLEKPAQPAGQVTEADLPGRGHAERIEVSEERPTAPSRTAPDVKAPSQLQLKPQDEQTPVQEKSLDEAWPVQKVQGSGQAEVTRKPAPVEERSAPDIDEGDLPTLVLQADLPEEESQEKSLRTILSDVSPGKSTDSSIELVPPRRPRPQMPPVQRHSEEVKEEPDSELPSTDVPDLVDETPALVESPSKPIVQRHDDEVVSRKTLEASAQSAPKPDSTDAPGAAGDVAKRPGYVPTEIGPLPSDLWDYLGEPPPPAEAPSKPTLTKPAGQSISPSTESEVARLTPEERPTQSFTPKPEARSLVDTPYRPNVGPAAPEPMPGYHDAAVDTVQREAVPTQTATPILDYATPYQPMGLESVLPWIQRQDETQQAETGTEESAEEGESGQGGGLDIEALAREILPIIKRKLSIEWERNRGRF